MDNESSRSKILLRDQSAKEKYFDSLVGGSGGGSGDVFFSPPSKMNFFDVHRDSSFELHHLIERVFVFDLDFSSQILSL